VKGNRQAANHAEGCGRTGSLGGQSLASTSAPLDAASMRRLILLLPLLFACASDIGEECDETGSSDECVDGAICDTTSGGTVCLKQCSSDADCASTEECNGVSGTNTKACHAK
jgi:hypothetical protein